MFIRTKPELFPFLNQSHIQYVLKYNIIMPKMPEFRVPGECHCAFIPGIFVRTTSSNFPTQICKILWELQTLVPPACCFNSDEKSQCNKYLGPQFLSGQKIGDREAKE